MGIHGDAVNIAARLEQLNKDFGTHALFSDTIVALLTETFPIESIGKVMIRSKSTPIAIHKLKD